MEQHSIWIAGLLCLALLGGAAAWWLRPRRRHRSRQRPLPADWPLASRPVFSSDERLVFRQLCTALPRHVVLSKLPLVRFCQPVDTQKTRYWYELLGSTHVTFAICSPGGRVLAAVDLAEGEHGGSRRTMQIKASVLTACRVRYLRCTASPLPSIAELQALVPPPPAVARSAPSSQAVDRSRDRLASTVATRRQQLSALAPDSVYGTDSGYGRPDAGDAGDAGDIGGIVVDFPVRLRH